MSHVLMSHPITCSLFFFFNDTATTEIYTLSLHDALPISLRASFQSAFWSVMNIAMASSVFGRHAAIDTGLPSSRSEEHRLNSSHSQISYAVFCLKKKKKTPAVYV